MFQFVRSASLVFMAGSVWLGSILGTTGSTLGAFSSRTINPSNTFSTQATNPVAPVVYSISPYDGATGVATNTLITVTFNESMTTGTTQSAFSLKQTSNDGTVCTTAPVTPCSVAGAFSWLNNNTLMKFTPSSTLTASQSFSVTIGTGATDSTFALNLAASATSSFQAGSGTSTVTPQVIPPTVPGSGATGVSTNSPIQITFNEQMDPTTTQAAFHLKQTSGAGSPCYVINAVVDPLCGSNGGAFSWGGPAANILSFRPTSNLTGSAAYTVTVDYTAQDLIGTAMGPNSGSSYIFSFTAAATADTTPPAAPTITSPAITVFTTASTYTVTGTTEANALVKILNAVSAVVGQVQLSGGLTSFSITIPLNTGTNNFTATATDAAGNTSAAASIPTINVNDTKTKVGTLSLSSGTDSIDVVVPFSGDANSNATATAQCDLTANGCPAGSVSLARDGTNLVFASTTAPTFGASTTGTALTGTGGTTFTVTVVITDPNGFDAASVCTSSTATTCTQTATIKLLAGNSGGSIGTVTVSPSNSTIASRAGQNLRFSVPFNCGTGCTNGWVQAQISVSGNAAQSSCVGGTASGTSVVTVSGQRGSGVWLADGSYTYDIRLFGTSGCNGQFYAAASGTLTINNAGSVAMSPAPSTVTLGANQNTTVTATVNNLSSSPVSDGASSCANSTCAAVTFSAVGSVTGTTGFTFSPTSANIGSSTAGCTVTASAGKACGKLTIGGTATAQTITVTATVQSQGAQSSYSGSTTILDPPLAPTGLVLTPGSINVAWNPSPTINVAGYKILLGRASGKYDRVIDVGNVTSYHIVDVEPSATYYVAVQSYTSEGLETPLTIVPEGSITTPAASATPTATLTATPTVNPCTTSTATATVTSTATATTTATGTPTLTVTPTATPVCTPTTTATATSTATATATVPADTPTSTPTSPPTATFTPAPPTATPTQAPSNTPTPTPTPLPPTSTRTAILPTATATRTAIAVPPTSTPSAVPTH